MSLLLVPLDGTAVAAVIGHKTFGVAKQTFIGCIKISKDIGPDDQSQFAKADTSDFISGMNTALSTVTDLIPSVIVAAWESSVNHALELAVRVLPHNEYHPHSLTCVPQVANAINLGIPVIVPAGTGAQDANSVSPARVPGAITVGATTINDIFAVHLSNFGPKGTILAPGKADLTPVFKQL